MSKLDKLQSSIKHLRRNRDIGAWRRFRDYYEANYKSVCYRYNTRWLVSIADTYADYGDKQKSALAHQIVTIAAFEKMNRSYTDRSLVSQGTTWDGMSKLSRGPGADMVKNWLRRLKRNMTNIPPLWWLCQTVLLRIAMTEGSIFEIIDRDATNSTTQMVLDTCRNRNCGEYIKLHKERRYGTSAKRHETVVRSYLDNGSVIDWGCGRSSVRWDNSTTYYYDPAIDSLSRLPPKANTIVCLDVLEHLHVADIVSNVFLMKRFADTLIFRISTRKAGHTLLNGQNAHATVKPAAWWNELLGALVLPNTKIVHSGEDYCLLKHGPR